MSMKRIDVLWAIVVLLFYNGVSATSYTVPTDFSDIQSAVNACGWTDTVWVDTGTYTGTINFNSNGGMFLLAVPGSKPVFTYDGVSEISLAGWQGYSCLIANSSYNSSAVTIDGFSISGVAAGGDTANQLLYGRFHLRNCEFYATTGKAVRIASGVGSGNVSVVNCRFHDCLVGLTVGRSGAEIQGNTIYNCNLGGSWMGAIGMEVVSGNNVIDNNIIYNCGNDGVQGDSTGCGIWSRGGRDNVYKNNLIYHNSNAVNYYDLSLRDSWINNTIVMNRNIGLEVSGTGNVGIQNNILMFNGGYDLYANLSGKSGWDIIYNCIGNYNSHLDTTFSDSLFAPAIGNVFSADPLFADTTDSINGFYLLVNSPCIDAGNPGILDPDSGRSDMGCYGGPEGKMKAPQWLRNLGSIVQTSGAPNDNLSWPQSDAADFYSYRVYHDLTTTETHYQPSAANQVAEITTQTLTSGSYPHGADDTWYRVSVVGDSTGYLLGGGFAEADTSSPVLEKAYYYCNGTSDPADDELRLYFNEGISPNTVNILNPNNDFQLSGVGDLTGATITSTNPIIIQMSTLGKMAAHDRSWIRINSAASSIADFYGNRAETLGDSVQVVTFNVYNTDNENSYESIQQAAEMAIADDFILVLDDGIYSDTVVIINDDVTIQADSLASPYIDIQGNGTYAFAVDADRVSIVGLNITGATTAGIRVKNSAGSARIIGNTCYGMATGIQVDAGAANTEVRSNICHTSTTTGISVNGDSTLVANNIVRDNSGFGISVLADYTAVRNNVVWNNGSIDIVVAGTSTKATNNISDGTISGTGSNNSIVNPINASSVFANASGYDFRLVQSATQWGAGENGENIGAYEGQVTRSGDGDTYLYHTINDAYAAAGADETLTAYQGRYYECLMVLAGKGVTLQAAAGTNPELRWDDWGIYESNRYYMLYGYGSDVFNLYDFIVDQENVNVPHNRIYYSNRSARHARVTSGALRRCTFRNSTITADPVSNRVSIDVYEENSLVIDSCAFYSTGHIFFSGCNNTGLKLVHDCVFDSNSQGLYYYNTNRILVEGCAFTGGCFFNDGGGRNLFFNNLFLGTSLTANSDVPYNYTQPNIWRNNTIINPVDGMLVQGVGDTLVNNIIWGSGGGSSAVGVANSGGTVVAYYNLVSSTGLTDVSAHNWNRVGTAPGFADSAGGDYHLLENSACIDGGDLRITDPDGGRSDIGAYGGPAADTAAPAHPGSLMIKYGMFEDSLTWTCTAPDNFAYYSVYVNSTSSNFQPGLADRDQMVTNPATLTAYVSHAAGVDNYYKVSVVDTFGYGSGYAADDTVPPAILSATYHSRGTRDVTDDELVLILSEWIADIASAAFGSGLIAYGEGDFSTALVSSGVRINDDTLVVTGMTAMAARNRTWIGFKPGAITDYAGIPCRAGSVLVETYNVTLDSAGDEYATIAAAEAAASPGQMVRILDNGLYRGGVTIDVPTLTVTPDSSRYVTLDGSGVTPLTVVSDDVLINGVRLTGGGDGLHGTGANLVVTNCISFNNSNDGFDLNGTAALYNSNAYQNRTGTGVRIAAGGTCKNVISSSNNVNYNLGAGVTQSGNFSFGGMVGDLGLSLTGNITGMDPLYETIDSTSEQFLMPGENSACANFGDSLPGIVDTDIRGLARPRVGYWDAGAYETDYTGKWLDHFSVSCAQTDTVAGAGILVSVTAYDQYDSVFTDYAHNVRVTALGAEAGSSIVYSGITDSGNGNGLIPSAEFNNGSASFSVAYTVAYDSLQILMTGPEDSSSSTGALVWYSGPLAAVSLNAGSAGDTITGVLAGRGLPDDAEVCVYDAYGNVIQDHSGPVDFTTTDSTATVPAGITMSAPDSGTVVAGKASVVFRSAGMHVLLAAVGGYADSVWVAVDADSALGRLDVVPMPDTLRAGDAFPEDVVVTAYDAYRNVMPLFDGTVGYSTDDASPYVFLPVNRTYTGADSGSYTYARGMFRLTTAGRTVVTVSSGSISTPCTLQVVPSVFDYIRVESAANGVGREIGDVVVSNLESLLCVAAAYDRYGNYRSDTTSVWDMVAGGGLVPVAGNTLPDTGLSYVFRSDVYDRSGYIYTYLPAMPFIADTTGLVRVVEDAGYENHVPVISAIVESLYYADALYLQMVTVTDSDAVDSNYFRLVAGPPAMSINETDGTVAWQTGTEDTGAVHVGIAVFDLDGASDTLDYTLYIEPSPFVNDGFSVTQVHRHTIRISCAVEDHYNGTARFVVYKDSSVLDTIGITALVDSDVVAGNSYIYEAALLIDDERETVRRQNTVIIDPIWVVYNDHRFNGIDNPANPGNLVDIGKEVRINVALENIGTQNALSVDAVLGTGDPYITVVDSIGGYNNIGVGDTTVCYIPMSFMIAEECNPGHVARLYLDINDSWGSAWKDSFEIVIEPLTVDVFVVDDDRIPDSDGNDNDIPEAGEIVELTPRVVNIWDETVMNVVGELVSLNGNCTVDSNDAVWSYGTIASGGSALPEFDYVFTMGATADTGNIRVALKVTGDVAYDGYSERRSWLIPIYGGDEVSGIGFRYHIMGSEFGGNRTLFDIHGNAVNERTPGVYFMRRHGEVIKVLVVE